MSTPEYMQWAQDPTPDNMANVVASLEPTLNSEVQRFGGPQELLKVKAKSLAVKAVKSYNPKQGAQLRSWVTTQLQPLARYSYQLRPVHAPELAIRQSAEVERVRSEMSDDMGREPTHLELADETGLSPKRIKKLQAQVRTTLSESTFDTGDDETSSTLPGTIEPNRMGMIEETVYRSMNQRDQAIYDWKVGRHGKASLSNQEIAKRLGVTPALVSQRSK